MIDSPRKTVASLKREQVRFPCHRRPHVKTANIALGAALMTVALLLTGCGHKLVATGGDSTVSVYPDKNTFDKLQSVKQQGGAIGGMIGGMGESLVSKKVDDKTPVKILSSDEKGPEVEILDGPNKVMQGYLGKAHSTSLTLFSRPPHPP